MIAEPESLYPLVRRLTEADLDRVMEIELDAYPYPWTRGIFSDCLRVGYDCWGLQSGTRLLGYCVLMHAAGETHLLNLCIDPQCQRRGLGDLLLAHVVKIARAVDSRDIFLEVRPSNPAGISLYRKNGFKTIGERPDYYRSDEGQENAIIMQLDLEPV